MKDRAGCGKELEKHRVEVGEVQSDLVGQKRGNHWDWEVKG